LVRAIELPQPPDEGGSAGYVAVLEKIVLDEGPCAMPERAPHRGSLSCKLSHAERGVAVHLVDKLFEIAKRKLPDRGLQSSERPLRQEFVALMHGTVVVAHRAIAEELRLAKIRVPTRTLDPASHHIVAARHKIGVMGRRGRQDGKNLVANFGRAAFVRIEAKDPFVPAFRDRAIAQVAESMKWELNDPRAEALRDLGRAVGAAGIGHHDLVGPQHARYRVRDFFGFVEGEDIRRYSLHVSSLLSPNAVHAITAGQGMQDERPEQCRRV